MHGIACPCDSVFPFAAFAYGFADSSRSKRRGLP